MERFDPRVQNGGPGFAPDEVVYEVGTGVPDFIRIRVDRREYVEQVFNVHIPMLFTVIPRIQARPY